MCQFFSCISDGSGKVLFFKTADIVSEMEKGNPSNYEWNSHTSISHFNGIRGVDEDKWNKWEYNPEKQELNVDKLNTTDDKDSVLEVLKKWFEGKDIGFIRNLYNKNSGDGNSGNGNSGKWNSGKWNSGDGNSGDGNSGDGNSGDGNSGKWNSGDGNSGNGNSGKWNSGKWNSGDGNSGDGIKNSFCSTTGFMLFNKPCSEKDYKKVFDIGWGWFLLTEWIKDSQMTEQEKKDHLGYQTTGGYLKTYSYKEAWSKCPKEVTEKIKKLKNFNKKVFFEISGLKV